MPIQDSNKEQPFYPLPPPIDREKRDEADQAIMQILSNQNFTAFQAKVILSDVERAIEHTARL